jgi:hypothetical protein
MATSNIFINGKSVSVSGQSITMVNGQVIVDGKPVNLDEYADDTKVFNIVVEGNVQSVSGGFADITVAGNAGSVNSQSGSVDVEGDVSGSVSTMSGSVRVKGDIGGNVSTMSGSIKR